LPTCLFAYLLTCLLACLLVWDLSRDAELSWAELSCTCIIIIRIIIIIIMSWFPSFLYVCSALCSDNMRYFGLVWSFTCAHRQIHTCSFVWCVVW
jgi:hypothetical protein